MNSELGIFKQSIKDFLTKDMLKLATLPFIFTIILMFVLFFTFYGTLIQHIGVLDFQSTQTTIQNGVPHTENISAKFDGSTILNFLTTHILASWMASFLLFFVGMIFTLYISVFVAILAIGFLTPTILKKIHQKHYNDVEMIGYSNIIEAMFLLVKYLFFMILFFIALTPFYFIPIINIIAFNLPLYYFFHKMMLYDISSNISTEKEFKQISFFNSKSLRVKTLTLYLISLIPFAIFFGAVFFVIYLGHSYFLEVRGIRATKSIED
ncbi:EI24 domain-containing protein [Sulfurimonas sp.]|uniref:EI24 domain-containing protein n=1 Tax=Sulfurimonas sp. TaxID=2022749 RepID=UPI0025E00FE3|nr:EI24 domain-containing protein [Sulfurimonas sp.]MDD5157190.1 EI24 domain-containing protein [Sulfurimonas sp.]